MDELKTEENSASLMHAAFEAIERAIWRDKEIGEIKGPNRLMADALIRHIWSQLEE